MCDYGAADHLDGSHLYLQEDDVAREKRDPNKLNWIDQLALDQRKREEDCPVMDTRWYVVDHWPHRPAPWNDEYNDWLEAKSRLASPYFDTLAEANEWKSRHDPEPEAELIVCQDNLREFTERRWVNW